MAKIVRNTKTRTKSISAFFIQLLLLLASVSFSVNALADPQIVEPSTGSTLSGPAQTFTWAFDGSDVERVWLYVGTTEGGLDIANSGDLGSSTKYDVIGIPIDGSAVHVRLWYFNDARWFYIDSIYTAANLDVDVSPPAVQSPTNNSKLASASVEFKWSNNNTPVNYWWLYLGTVQGGKDLYDSGRALRSRTSVTIDELPTDGSPVYARLWFRTAADGWKYADTQYETDTNTVTNTGSYRSHFQGLGSDTPGGRGGSILRVTNLNDAGPGSFREAVTNDEARIVVFEVSGTIVLTSRLTIDDSRLTIAGQSAPSPGVTINARCGIRIEASDIVIQHIRIRRGDYSGCGDLDTVWVRNNAARIIFDHVSLSWGVDGTLDFNAATGPEPTDIIVVDSIISETLRCSIYGEIDPTRACHSRAMLQAPNIIDTSTMTLARNLFAHHSSRLPAVSGGWDVTNVNNVMYNYAPDTARHGPVSYINGPGGSFATTAVNRIAQIGTVAITGPDTPADTLTIRTQNLYPGSTMYLRDNVGEQMVGPNGDAQWTGVWDSGRMSSAAEFRIDSEPQYLREWNILPSSDTVAHVLHNAGARPVDRDAIDARIIMDVRNRSGQLIDTQAEVGGLPRLAENTRLLNVPTNPHEVVDDAGRTAVEAWLEAMAKAVENP